MQFCLYQNHNPEAVLFPFCLSFQRASADERHFLVSSLSFSSWRMRAFSDSNFCSPRRRFTNSTVSWLPYH